MKIFFIGDYKINSGPSNVNKHLKKYLPKNTLYISNNSKVARLIEILIKVTLCDKIVFSGLSKQNIIGIKWSKILRKKTFYIMHGSVSYENEINGLSNKKHEQLERLNLDIVDCIICVSETFMNWMKDRYPSYKNKLTYINNGVDWDLMNLEHNKVETRDNRVIMTSGGGMPRKNIISICKAIEKINKDTNINYKLIVVGDDGKDTEKIKEYSFVEYKGKVNKEEYINYLKQANIFIQNSIFETFGLAPIEALMCGCNLLMAKNIGAIGIFKTINKDDLILDCFDYEEICEKIIRLSNDGNNNKLITDLDKDCTSFKYQTMKLVDKIKED